MALDTLKNKGHYYEGIWKARSMVFYLSNRFTNPIMCGIMIKSYLSSMLWHLFHEDAIIQRRKMSFLIYALIVYWKTQNFSGKYNFLHFKKCADHEIR